MRVAAQLLPPTLPRSKRAGGRGFRSRSIEQCAIHRSVPLQLVVRAFSWAGEFRRGFCQLFEFRPVGVSAIFSNSSRSMPAPRISSCARARTEEVAPFGNHATDRARSVYGCHWSSAIGGQPTYLGGGYLSSLRRQRAVYLPARGPRGAMGVGGPLAGARGPGAAEAYAGPGYPVGIRPQSASSAW